MPVTMLTDKLHFQPHFHTTLEEKGLEIYKAALGHPDFLEWANLGETGDDVLAYMLEGRVLDFGSGITEAFSGELRKQELETKIADLALKHYDGTKEAVTLTPQDYPEIWQSDLNIVSLNPDYATRVHGKFLRSLRLNDPLWLHQSIAAWGHQVPLRDGAFRGIIGLSSLTLYAGPNRSKAYTKEWLSESVRLLEPGGLGFFFPIFPNFLQRSTKAYQKIAEKVCKDQVDFLVTNSGANMGVVAIRKLAE